MLSFFDIDVEPTVQSDNAEDEDDGQGHDDDGVDLETGGLVGVQP